VGEVIIPRMMTGQVGGIGYPADKKTPGDKGAVGRLDQLNTEVISGEVLYDVVAKDDRKAGRMVLKMNQTIVKGYFYIRLNLASRLNHVGRLVHPKSHQTLLG